MLTTTKKSLPGKELSFRLSRLSARHPMGTLLFLFLFLVPPVGMLAAVTLSTALVSIPLALLFGWV